MLPSSGHQDIVARYRLCAATCCSSHLAIRPGPLETKAPWQRCVKSGESPMFARGNPADAAPAALKPIQRLVSNAGTDARAYASMFAQFALSTCGSHPLPRSVRPIGPVVLRNRSSLKARVRTSYFRCMRPVRAPKVDECRRLVFTDFSTDLDDASTAEPPATAPP